MKPAPACDSQHLRYRSGERIACARCPQPCPVCHGNGHRANDDGERPPCGRCRGLGWLKPVLSAGGANAAGTLPPVPDPHPEPAAFSCDISESRP